MSRCERMLVPDQFSRVQLLLGEDAMRVLAQSRVAVFGVGGVGGYALEALARNGVGALDLVDDDVVSPTNINRQIVATHSVIGKNKVDIMAARIADINPDCRITTHQCFYLPDTSDQFDFTEFDYVIDAVDTVTAKLHLAQTAHDAGTPFISCMGAANKLDPTAFEVADIYDTDMCPLAKIIRKECRKRGIAGFKVVYSRERALHPAEEKVPGAEGDQGYFDPHDHRHPARRSTPGSVSFVPPVAGFICAGEVIKDLLGR